MKVKNTRYGDMMFLENDRLVGRSLDLYGEVNYFKVEFLKKLITSEEDVIVDVGANIGSVTVPLAKKVPEGYVLALEPHTHSFYTLCGNIALNKLTNVQVFNRAGSDNSNKICYFPSVDIDGDIDMSSIRLSSILNGKDLEERKCENPVSAIAIDDLKLANPRLIKISAQGMEVSILNGGRKTIDRATPALYVSFSENQEDVLKFLETVGYDWELHEPPCFNPNNFAYGKIDEINGGVSQSVFAYPKGDRPEVEDEYLVDLDKSEDHQDIRNLRDNLSQAEFSTV